jgi:enoyl-CoA hydratase
MVNFVYSISELFEISQEDNWAGATGENLLCLDLRGAALSTDQATQLNAWLAKQAVPVIGLVTETCPLMDGLDLALETDARLALISERIESRPHASAVLAQTTRITSILPTASALVAESLAYATLQGGVEFTEWLEGRHDKSASRPSADASEPVKLKRNGNELHITLANPDNRNALSVAMRDSLSSAFSLVATDDSIERIFVSGEGPCFSAGGDLNEFGSCSDLSEAHRIRQLRMPAGFLAEQADRYTFQLHGACIGAGIELPAFAGRVTARRDAFFRLPEVAMGLIPGAGGCVSIPRRIGRHRTNYFAITGEDINADQALTWGLIDAIED